MAQLGPTIVTLQTDVRRQGGTPIDRIWEWVDGTLKWQDTCAGASNRGYATLTLPASSRIIGKIAELQVIRIDQPQPVGAAAPFKTWEYRITELDDAAASPNVVVTCAPIINDFGRVLLRSVNGGVPSKLTTFTGTPTDFVNALFLPALIAQGKTGIVAGTIDDGPAMQYSQRNASVLAVGSWLEQTYTKDFFLERVDDTTDLLHFTTRGSGVPSPRAILGKNIRDLKRTIIVDDNVFANLVEPEGATANGEAEPTTIAQAAWDATAASGTGDRDVTLADPLGGEGPVTFDGELTGKRAFYALDPLHLEAAETVLPTSPIGNHQTPGCPIIAIDPTRRILWGYTQNDSDTIWWRSLTDDSSSGSLSLGAGSLYIERLVYDAVNDRIVATCGDIAKVVIVNAGTKAVAGTVTTSAVPAHCCGVGNGHVIIGYFSSADFDVVDCSGSGSVQGTLSGTSSFDGRESTVVYHAGTNRYFAFSGSVVLPFKYYNASTLASVATGSGLANGAVVNTDPSQTAIAALTTSSYYSIDPSSGAVTTVTAPALPYSPTGLIGVPFALFGRFGRLYLIGKAGTVTYDVATNAWLIPITDIGRAAESSPWVIGFDLEVGASADDSATLYIGDIGCVRRFVLRKFVAIADGGDTYWVSPFESWDIQDSIAATQTITAPASGSGGPVTVETEADGAGQGVLVEIRENANLDYRTQLSDPSSIAASGEADAAPQFDVLAKRNYWRGSTFDAGAWRSTRTNRWLSAVWEGPSRFGAMEQRWSQADQTGFAFLPVVTTATWNNSTTTPDLTISISGLNSGTVLSPGDVIGLFPSFPASLIQHMMYVRQRTIADSGGNATVPITPLSPASVSSIASGTTMYLTSPSLLIANNKPDCLVLYPTRAVTTGFVLPRWPVYTATIPVPKMIGDQRAWVVAHVKIACYCMMPSDLHLTAYAPFTASALSGGSPQTVSPADTVQLTTGELRDYWLSIPIDTINYPAHGFIRAQLTMGPTSASMPVNGLNAVVYVQSMGVVLAANSPEPQDVYGAEGPIALYQLGAARLEAIHNPTHNYQLSVVDDDVARPWDVGAIATLRDPQRAIFAQDQSSRVISVTRYGKLPDTDYEAPDVEIGHAPLNTFVPGIVAAEGAVTTPAPALLPGTPIVGGGGGTGGGVGGSTEPGNLNPAIPLLNLGTGAGDWQARARYDIDNSPDYLPTGSTRNGGPAWRTRTNSSLGASMAVQKTDVGRTVFIDLQGKTIPGDGMLVQQWMDNVSFTPSLFFWLDSSYVLHAGRTDGAGDVALPGCDATSALSSSAKGWLELIGKIGATAGAAIAYWTPLGGARVKLFDQRALNTVSDQNATGTGVGVDVLGPSAWTASTGASNGPAGVLLSDEHAFDRSGVSLDDVSGRCCIATTFPSAAGHYADVLAYYDDFNAEDQEGDFTPAEFTGNDQRVSFKLAALDANVGQVNAVAPFYATRQGDMTGAPIGRPAIRSGTTDVEGADVAVPSFTVAGGHYYGFNVDAVTDDLNPRFAPLVDPGTSLPWTLANWANAEVVWRQRIAGNGALLCQLGVDVSCYPATGTNGPGPAVGSRPIPYRVICGASMDASDTQGNELYHRLGTTTGNQLGSGSGTDSSRNGVLDSTYSAGNVDFGFGLNKGGGALNGFYSSAGAGFVDADDYPYLPNIVQFGQSLEAYQALWFNLNSATIATELGIFRIKASLAGAEQVRLSLNSSRQFVATRRDTSPFTLQTSTATCPTSGRVGIAWRVRINPDDANDCYVKVWLTTSGPTTRTLIIDTEGSGHATNANGFGNACGAACFFGVYGTATDGDGATFDDPVVANPGTTSSNTPLANGRWGNLTPSAAGTYQDSATHSASKVADSDYASATIPDGNYNILTAAAKKDSFTMPNVAGDASAILAALIYGYISLPHSPAGSAETGRPFIVLGGTILRGPKYKIASAQAWKEGRSLVANRLTVIKNRVTGAQVTPSDLNAAEVGWETVTHTADDQWVGQLGIDYFYEWTI